MVDFDEHQLPVNSSKLLLVVRTIARSPRMNHQYLHCRRLPKQQSNALVLFAPKRYLCNGLFHTTSIYFSNFANRYYEWHQLDLVGAFSFKQLHCILFFSWFQTDNRQQSHTCHMTNTHKNSTQWFDSMIDLLLFLYIINNISCCGGYVHECIQHWYLTPVCRDGVARIVRTGNQIDWAIYLYFMMRIIL